MPESIKRSRTGTVLLQFVSCGNEDLSEILRLLVREMKRLLVLMHHQSDPIRGGVAITSTTARSESVRHVL